LEIQKLKKLFLEHVSKYEEKNVSNTRNLPLRIATFNVHYFTDIYDINTYNTILEDIRNINADIIILQEVIVGGTIKITDKTSVNVSNLYDDLTEIGYNKKILCNSVPSWFQAVYGNLLLMKNELCKNKKDSNHNICEENQETVFTFDKSATSVKVSGSHEGTNETRCFIYCQFTYHEHNFHIFGFHLDVGTEATRIEQINKILERCELIKQHKSDDYIILLGDFNTTEQAVPDNTFLQDNGKVYQALMDKGYFDCSKINQPSPTPTPTPDKEMTVWTNQVVDFIFCNKKLDKDNPHFTTTFNYYFTKSSDHLPIFITLTPK